MGDRFPGGVISKTPPTVTGPATSGPLAGEGGSASGVWTLDELLGYQKANDWPKPVLPRPLYAWGGNGQGQLGQGNVAGLSSPTQIGSLTNWAQVSFGATFSAAIKTDGTLWTWGRNIIGQLGDGTVINRSSPVQVGVLTNWLQVSCGGDFSAGGFSAAVKTDGTLWLWGRNNGGQLGQGNVTNRSSPVQVGSLTNWSQVSLSNTSGNFTLAITKG